MLIFENVREELQADFSSLSFLQRCFKPIPDLIHRVMLDFSLSFFHMYHPALSYLISHNLMTILMTI